VWYVSRALEDEERIPGQRAGTPILGMADGSPQASKAQHHGDFDYDLPTGRSTFGRILGRDGRGQERRRQHRVRPLGAQPDVQARGDRRADRALTAFLSG
jgi:hypothetical protein